MLEYDPFASNKTGPKEGQKIKVFACTHIYHIRCLKNTYMSLMGQTPEGKQEVLRLFRAGGQEKLRCITCNLNNLDIEGKEGVKKARFQAANQPSKTQEAAPDTPKVEEIEEENEEREKAGPSIAHIRSQSIINKKLGRLQKKMEDFERYKVTDGVLGLNDFRNR